MSETFTIRLSVNGRELEGRAEARTSLADFLRDELGLTGTHVGCEHGVCGACTVLLDGAPVRSCLTARGAGRRSELTTVEGLATDGKLHPIQQRLPGGARPAVRLLHAGLPDQHGSSCCGAIASPATTRSRTRSVVSSVAARATSRSWPRCGAQRRSCARRTGAEPWRRVRFVGRSVPRVEDPKLLTGSTRFIDDLSLPGMLHCAILRSPHAHARVVSVDASEALCASGGRRRGERRRRAALDRARADRARGMGNALPGHRPRALRGRAGRRRGGHQPRARRGRARADPRRVRAAARRRRRRAGGTSRKHADLRGARTQHRVPAGLLAGETSSAPSATPIASSNGRSAGTGWAPIRWRRSA